MKNTNRHCDARKSCGNLNQFLSLILAFVLLMSIFTAQPLTALAAESDAVADTGASYNLWLGSVRVTDANKNALLGDWRNTFDPATNTLTLNNPVIDGYIFSSGIDLTIKGTYHMPENGPYSDYGLWVSGGSLKLDGDFSFYGYKFGIYAGNNITVCSGTLIAKETTIQNFENNIVNPYFGILCNDGILKIESAVDCVNVYGASVKWGAAIGANYIDIGEGLTITNPEGGSMSPLHLSMNDYHIYDGYTFYNSDGGRSEQVVISKSYNVWIGSTQVTGENKNDILNDGGKAQFDPDTSTLYLYNPTIPGVYNSKGFICKIYSSIGDLTINGTYRMTEAESNDGIYCDDGSLTLNGSFTVLSGRQAAVYAEESLTVVGNSLTAKSKNGSGLYAEDGITIGSVRTLTAEGDNFGIHTYGAITISGAGSVIATSNSGSGIFARGDITIGSVMRLTAEGGEYGIDADKGYLTINSAGTITAKGGEYSGIRSGNDFKIISVNTLTAEGVDGLNSQNDLIISGGTIHAKGNTYYGLYAVNNITINSRVISVEAEGDECAIMAEENLTISNYLAILKPSGGVNKNGVIYHSDGTTPAQYAKIGVSQKYDLWIGSTQVTDINKDSLCGSSSNHFDPDTNTLTLNNPRITGSYDGYSVIYSELDDLTVTGKAMINRPDVTEAIVANTLTLIGDFNFTADEGAVFVPDGNLTIENSTLKLHAASGGTALDCESGNLLIKNSTITTVDTRIWVNGDVRTENSTLEVDSYFYDHDIYAGGGMSFTDSSVTASGSPKYGILADDGPLTVSNSTVNAYGSEIGIVCRKTISISGYLTNITARGGVIGIMGIQNMAIDSTTGYLQANGQSRAISSNALVLGSNLSITDAAGNALKKEGNKIVTSRGNEATYVVIKTTSSEILGDTDGNGDVEIRDATWIQRDAADIDIPFAISKKTADIDGDGEITVMDATAIQYYLANMKTSYPIGKPV